ncbi:MAG: Tetratricopeptide 2 repeat protein [Pedosphaera sp.]|nr:Tetratricopeptide 2 repeat protein [Pedosphaera sp.]
MQRDAVSATDHSQRDRMVCALLALITLALYWPARNFEFNNYDDAQYLTQNLRVQSGLTWDSAAWSFTTGYASNWHPMTWLSHMLDWQIYGAKAGGHHLTGVVFHAANTALLFLLLRRLTGAFWRCIFVAALFAWHPLHVESVAWVAERKDVLSAFFGLLTLLAYAHHARKFPAPHFCFRGGYGLALFFFALGLMSKPMLVSLPLLLLLLDYWPLNRVSSQFPVFNFRLWLALVREKIPLLILSAASCAVTFLVQKNGHSVQSLEILSLRERAANALVAYVRYLEKLLWPVNLSIVYPYSRQLPVMEVAAAAILLALVCWVAWRFRSRHPWLIVGWAWFVVTLVPVIGLVQVGGAAMADRYSYLPSIGLFLAIAWEAGRAGLGRVALGALAALALAGCLVGTSRQLRYWQNSETLFAHAIAVTKDNALAQCNLGSALIEQGRKAEAAEHLKEALRINQDFPEAINIMAKFLADAGKGREAVNLLETALRRNPDCALEHLQLGTILYQEGRLDEAAASFRSAVRINPGLDKAHADLGILLAGQGRADEAIAEFQSALASEPNNAYAHNGLGRILESRGNLAGAAAQYSSALQAKPDFADAHDNLGAVLGAQKQFSEAERHFQAALKIQPDFAEAHYNYGNVFAAQGRLTEAAAQYAAAVSGQPDYLEAHFNLALALNQTSHAAEAITHYRAVLRLKPGFIPALEKLGWILATNPDAALRDGTEALRLASLAAQPGQPADATAWDIMAAAYAETGKFAEAADAARKALIAAESAGRADLAAQIHQRLGLYVSGQAYREP